MFNHVFKLVYKNCQPNEKLSAFLEEKIHQDIIEFGTPSLPDNLKIEVEIISRDVFFKKLSATTISRSIQHCCMAYSDSSIHCIDYKSVSEEISLENYFKAIRHECIHLLQHLATQVVPQTAIWLYESIACARAEQQTLKPTTTPSWADFVVNFYEHPTCYALAYIFGKELLKNIPLSTLNERCHNFDAFTKVCETIYNATFSK